MDKENVMKDIALIGFRIEYDAQKYFATYDIVKKMPTIIGLLTISFGVLLLEYAKPTFSLINISLIILGILGFYISNSKFSENIIDYKDRGEMNNKLVHELHLIYKGVSYDSCEDLQQSLVLAQGIESNWISMNGYDHVLGAGSYCRFRIAKKQSASWIKTELRSRFWKTLIEKSLTDIFVCIALIAIVLYILL